MSKKTTKAVIVKQNVGIDISKDDFKICLYCRDNNDRKFIKGTRTFKNNLNGFEGLIKWLTSKCNSELPVHITIEATGVYYENLTHFLYALDYTVHVILPNQSKAYAQSLNLKSKTDKIDAKMLGLMGLEREPSDWTPASPKMRTLKQLTRDRVALLEEKTAVSNKLHALNHSYQPHKKVIQRIKQRLALLKKQIKQVEQEIEAVVKADEVLSKKIENICKVKGLGIVTVATIVAETNGFTLFTSRGQLISYAGYDVVENQSGLKQGKTRISKKGNRHIRRALHFPALSMVKHEPHFKQMFERILLRTGIKMKAYVAVQRKALILIYTLFKKDIPYDANYHKKTQKKEELSILNV